MLPSVEDLIKDSPITDIDTTRTREEYAKIILLLFYPYRVQDDLLLNESYWNRYNEALSENKISPHGLQVIQNIQDVHHNCTKLKTAEDTLLKTTTCLKHDLDNKVNAKNDEPTISFDQISDMLEQKNNYGVREVHPTKRNLSIIASRCHIIQQDIPDCEQVIPNITDVPEGIKIACSMSDSNKECINKKIVNAEEHCQHTKKHER